MKRKTIDIKLADKKLYSFSERNREDLDFSSVIEYLRKINLCIIQESVKDKDQQLALMMSEMKRSYSVQELSLCILNNREYLEQMSYDSFKIANENINFEEFKKLIPPGNLKNICSMINLIETDGEPEKKKMKAAPSQLK